MNKKFISNQTRMKNYLIEANCIWYCVWIAKCDRYFKQWQIPDLDYQHLNRLDRWCCTVAFLHKSHSLHHHGSHQQRTAVLLSMWYRIFILVIVSSIKFQWTYCSFAFGCFIVGIVSLSSIPFMRNTFSLFFFLRGFPRVASSLLMGMHSV